MLQDIPLQFLSAASSIVALNNFCGAFARVARHNREGFNVCVFSHSLLSMALA
jgi:hypothetical protein